MKWPTNHWNQSLERTTGRRERFFGECERLSSPARGRSVRSLGIDGAAFQEGVRPLAFGEALT